MSRTYADAVRVHAALAQLIEAHSGVMWSLALGLPVPNTTEEMWLANNAKTYARQVAAAVAEAN